MTRLLGSRSRVRSPLRTDFSDFYLKKKELTSWWSVALLSTKNRRGELWDSRLTPQLEECLLHSQNDVSTQSLWKVPVEFSIYRCLRPLVGDLFYYNILYFIKLKSRRIKDAMFMSFKCSINFHRGQNVLIRRPSSAVKI